MEVPAISVIIPMYNVEKYIGECLDSLLAQTFKKFEVIVVDDCSTDNSAAVVESYAKKFGGRLQLKHTKKNSGSGTYPRNLGLAYSRGEYVYFMDNDDTITQTAFKELYTHAKKFDADVVHCEKYYMVPENFRNNGDFRQYLKPYNYLTGEQVLVREPVIWDNNFEERVKIFVQRRLIWNFWVQLIRRDFLVENKIKMVGIMADDMLLTLCEICCAKKYVIVPNVVYFYRDRQDSLIHKKAHNAGVESHMHSWITMIKEGFNYLDEFLSDNEFFARRSDLKYILFDMFVNQMLNEINEVYAQVPAHVLDELLRKEFCTGDNVALTSFIFNAMNIHRLNLMQAYRKIAALENELKRIR